MTDAGPAAVRRHLLRPLPWLAATLLLSAVFVLTDVLEQRDHARRLADALRLEGEVLPSYRGGVEVPVAYLNPLTEQRVELDVHVFRARLPAAGQRVAIEVDRDDPGAVVLAGDRFTVAENLPVSVMWPLIPVVAMGLRWQGARRARALLAAPTTYVMLAALAPPPRLGRYCRLHLFPLDAGAGAPSVCAVPVVTTAGFPVPSAAFEVDVKGVPRPAGRVVVRTRDGVLWPASRALTSGRLGRPPAVEAPEPVALPAVPPPDPLPMPGLPWPLALGELGGVAATALVLAVVAVATLRAAGESERLAARSVRTVAEVVEADSMEYFVVVELTDPATGEKRRAQAPVDWPEDHPVGRRYPVLVSAEGVRLVREPYDAVEPIGWAMVPFVAATLVLLRRVRQMQANRRVLRTGPFTAATAWRIASGHASRLGLGVPGRPLRVVAVVGGDPVGPAGPVVVAGEAVPGAPVALVVGGRPVVPAGPGVPPPWPPGRDEGQAPVRRPPR